MPETLNFMKKYKIFISGDIEEKGDTKGTKTP